MYSVAHRTLSLETIPMNANQGNLLTWRNNAFLRNVRSAFNARIYHIVAEVLNSQGSAAAVTRALSYVREEYREAWRVQLLSPERFSFCSDRRG